MKYDQSIHDYYAANLGPAEIGRIIGRSRYVAQRMKQSQKFDTWALKKLMAAHPISPPASAPAIDENAAPAPSVTVAEIPPTQETETTNNNAKTQTAVDVVSTETEHTHTPAEHSTPAELTQPEFSPMQTYSNIADALPDGAKCMILMPGRFITTQALYCVRALCDNSQGKIVFGEPESIYDIHMARNRMADRFLQSDCTWSFWLDTDNIIPAERPEWYKRNVPAARRWADPNFAAMNGINRLASHHLADKTKKIVGACYFDRMGRGVPMFAAGRENPDQRTMLNNAGPRNAVVPAGRYAGTGALLVHRQVYLDIAAIQPEGAIDQAKYQWEGSAYGYFDRLDRLGDDVSFCARAIKAGHQPFVDLAVCAAHVGDYCYTHEIINPQ